MKAKNFLFVTFFLASAGLGLALPQSSTAFFPRADAELTGASKVVLDAANANAEDPGKGISPDCSAAIVKVVANPEFGKCVPLAALAPITPIVTDPSVLKEFLKDPAKNYEKLVEKPLVELATGICAAPKCSDKGNAAAIQALADGCKADLQTNDFVKLLFTVAVFYSPLRDIGCFKDKDQFCFDQTALTLIKLPPSPLKLTGDPFLDSIAVSDPLAICTKCNHDIVNTIFNFIKAKQDAKDPFVFAILAQAGIDDKKIDGAKIGSIVKCGLQFVDGTTPKEALE